MDHARDLSRELTQLSVQLRADLVALQAAKTDPTALIQSVHVNIEISRQKFKVRCG